MKELSIPASRSFRTGLVLLILWGVGALILSIFPTDLPGSPPTIHGGIHLIVAAIAFLCGAFGTLALSLQLVRFSSQLVIGKYALSISILTVVLCFVTFVGLSTRIGGLLERLFLGSVLFWILMVSLYLINPTRASRLQPSKPEYRKTG